MKIGHLYFSNLCTFHFLVVDAFDFNDDKASLAYMPLVYASLGRNTNGNSK